MTGAEWQQAPDRRAGRRARSSGAASDNLNPAIRFTSGSAVCDARVAIWIGLSIGAVSSSTSAVAQTAAPSLTVGGMIAHADPLVKAVMAVLLCASIATWTIFAIKIVELRSAKRMLRADALILDAARTLDDARIVVSAPAMAMVAIGRRELERSAVTLRSNEAEGIKDRFAARLMVVEAQALQSMLTGVNLLASIGATAPFIGLSGTVWGIMNSFIGISRSHATSLAVVAPGIAEALLATAMGLAAAIPAVLIYNLLTRSIAGYRRLLVEVSVLTACVLSCQLEDATVEVGGKTGHRAATGL